MLNLLIEKLSQRFRSENDLSDITWVVAETAPEFQKLFLKFFFQTFDETENIVAFVREFTNEDCRPDFYIKTDCKEYIVECKKQDKSHHFVQYKERFPNASFGYIANYYIPPSSNCEIRTWRGFKRYLQIALAKTTKNDFERQCIELYVLYLTNVCTLYDIKKMKLNTLLSLIEFDRLLEKIHGTIEGHESVEYDGKAKNYDRNRYGRYFSLKKDGSNVKIWPWLGAYFDDKKVIIYFEVNEKWCKPVYQILIDKENESGTFFKTPEFDQDYSPSLIFEMKQEYFEKFNSEQASVEEQEKILKDFMNEVIDTIKPYY